ncbi:Superfamily I DNA and RNA helicase [Paramagnetospirillum magnetotacticum MS-1]|uniref:Superfamily I DNA and RNA helicase n=1 Tax=Paramagnetospirillum magnetotacticum MS-1 TaxID=272627 RepID=A0A0C2YP56_PARME|nr:TM0106 family RecB-like putative nuclease [Paramagnetospirillum magnetotacticum]KIL96893.1 Superfamily I DNA and RNA helicase [Paramagnetospirillum magnetotacticum MS-1]
MRRFNDDLLLSSGDLTTFLGCRHASALDYRALDENLETAAPDATLEFLQQKGIAHEQAYLAKLKNEGRLVAIISDHAKLPERVQMTLEAMRRGDEVIYQAALHDGCWHGFADFLERSPVPSALGGWSYDVADTKLSTSMSAKYAVQLSIYSNLIAAVQGRAPTRMSICLGNGNIETLRPGDYVHYIGHAQRRLEAFLADNADRGATLAEPCAHCGMCQWRDRCKAEWVATDHLSLVANIRSTQREKLLVAGVNTVTELAEFPDDQCVPGMNPDILRRLRAQARLQVAVRGNDQHLYELLPAPAGRGFARMPRPAEVDLFFDMEGDPLYPGGLEYLFGVHVGHPETGKFLAFWGHDRAGEKKALEDFLDFVTEHLAQHPDAHIYHYNHYEITAVRRLAMAHATREAVVDDLLRHQKFVDLLKVVREGLLVSEPRYSLKNIEHFYMGKRDGDVATAADSIVAYEKWRATPDQQTLDDIEHYNAIDCRSTALLRDWLLSIRPAETTWFDPADVAPDEETLARQAEAETERLAIEARLLTDVSEVERPFRQLVADLVEFHRREAKPGWWALFDRQDREENELIDDTECLGGLRLQDEPVKEKQSLVHTYHFPPQETKLRKGGKPLAVDTLERVGTVERLDMDRGVLVLKRAVRKGPLPQTLNIGPESPIANKVLRGAIRRFADSVADGSGKFLAVERILRRAPPYLTDYAPGQPLVVEGQGLVDAAITAVGAMDNSHLFIQGPPGTGKTYTSSHVIVEMMRRGKTIGVASNSHKAINNLLAGIEKAAKERGFIFSGIKKSTDEENAFGGSMIRDVYDNAEVLTGTQLIAGTAWMFAREEFEQTIDYLFIDEAGQVALGHLVAMGTAARNIVLVGDQQQLGQPVQGVHPGESGANALDHLLQGAATVPPDRGIFLDVSWRMHPAVCRWISDAIYEGRLHSHPSTAQQALLLDNSAHAVLASAGLRFLPIDHVGRSQRCPEEAETIKAIWHNLLGQRWRDRHGVERSITPEDVLVVAPYNVQVNTIRDALPDGARVGTVDKFQGQEAVVAIVSMTTSSGDDLPRDIEFLFSRNRLNVAVSRAQCLAIVVASPRLLEVTCGSVRDMRLVDTLCHAYQWGIGQ